MHVTHLVVEDVPCNDSMQFPFQYLCTIGAAVSIVPTLFTKTIDDRRQMTSDTKTDDVGYQNR